MSWKIWKSHDKRMGEEYRKAVSYRNQGNMKEAIEHFLKAAELGREAKKSQAKELAKHAYALATLYQAVSSNSPEDLMKSHNSLATLQPNTILELPYKAMVEHILPEIKVLADEYRLPPIDLQNFAIQNADEVALQYEQVAQAYLGLGHEKFVIGDLFNIEENIFKRSYKCLGLSKLLKGCVAEDTDPNKGVEFYAEALGYFGQAALKEHEAFLNDKNVKLANVAKCWFCGRDIQGEDVHFVYMETFLTQYLNAKGQTQSPRPVKGGKIAACKGCFGGISITADKTARHYYQQSINALRQVEHKLTTQINHLRNEVRRLATYRR
ncbi:MAG: tetratricopeptide repeat protein [Candidatus Ranarchaeia archaeon]|jgi:tetratricopeptide (TPR) repeat protein